MIPTQQIILDFARWNFFCWNLFAIIIIIIAIIAIVIIIIIINKYCRNAKYQLSMKIMILSGT